MYISIVFDDIRRDSWNWMFGSPNGTVLSSKNALSIQSLDPQITNIGICTHFWYIDDYILNKYYDGINNINYLKSIPGVLSVNILDISDCYKNVHELNTDEYNQLLNILNQHIIKTPEQTVSKKTYMDLLKSLFKY